MSRVPQHLTFRPLAPISTVLSVMKCSWLPCSVASIALLTPLSSLLAQPAKAGSSLVYETPDEFFAQGDFDGDGRADVVIVDKATGKYRLAYQLTNGVLSWVDCRPSSIKPIGGFAVGKVLVDRVNHVRGCVGMSREPPQCGAHKQLEAHHSADRIAGQAKHQLSAVGAEE